MRRGPRAVAGTTIHDLRHTAASLRIAARAEVKAVQLILALNGNDDRGPGRTLFSEAN